MNISPISNTSFRGILSIWNKNDDREKKAQINSIINYDSDSEASQLKGNGNSLACYSDNAFTMIDTDYIRRITPKAIDVYSILGQARVDISNQDYNTILTAYAAASNNSNVNINI